MALRHPRQSHQTTTTTTRSLPLRIFSTVALILPVILLIISFACALATIYSPQWAVQDIFYANGTLTSFHNYRAPFYSCRQTDAVNDDLEVAGVNSTCHRIHGIGLQGFHQCTDVDIHDSHKCQQTVLSANLLVAGVVFLSIAMALAAAVLGTGIKAALATTPTTTTTTPGSVQENKAEPDHEHGGHETGHSTAPAPTPVDTVTLTSGLDAGMLLLASLGSAMLLLAQVVGVNALVNDALPNANFQEFMPNQAGNNIPYSSWYMGKASYIFVTVAWLAGLLASFVSRYV